MAFGNGETERWTALESENAALRQQLAEAEAETVKWKETACGWMRQANTDLERAMVAEEYVRRLEAWVRNYVDADGFITQHTREVARALLAGKGDSHAD